jgi:DsbC/DsbD-like thiol-disulfide interchange protein
MMRCPQRTPVWALIVLSLLADSSGTAAQSVRRPVGILTSLVERTTTAPGTLVRAALQVRLPSGIHVNSDTPRDPALVPLTITADPPAGIALTAVAFPQAVDLVQQDADQPLSVFERAFAIGLQFQLASDLKPGPVDVAIRMRYQACDASRCFLPATEETTLRWDVATSGEIAEVPEGAVFSGMRFRSLKALAVRQ